MRWRQRRGPTRPVGSVSIEYAAVVVVAATLVAVLLAVPLGDRVGAWTRYATCLVIGLDCRRQGPDGSAAPASCHLATTTSTTHARLTVAVVDVAGAEGYRIVESSDGRVAVTYTVDAGAGASLAAGHHLAVDHGGHGVTAGAGARVGVGGNLATGTTWTFDSRADADAWIDWHRAVEVVRDRYDTPLVLRWNNPLAWGRRDSVGARLDHAIARRVNAVKQRLGGGVPEPPEPRRTERIVEGGWELEGSALAGVGVADAATRLGAGTRLGQAVDATTGETTLHLGLDTEALATASAGAGAATAGLAASSTLALTVDGDGRATSLRLVAQVPGSPGLDVGALEDPRDVLGAPWHAHTGAASLYELTMTMPLSDTSVVEVLDRLVRDDGASASDGRPGSLVDELWERGRVGVVEYAVTRAGGGLDAATAVGIGGGVGGGRHRTEARATSAYHLDHPSGGGDRVWTRWASCVPG